jgi:hypothetical protein
VRAEHITDIRSPIRPRLDVRRNHISGDDITTTSFATAEMLELGERRRGVASFIFSGSTRIRAAFARARLDRGRLELRSGLVAQAPRWYVHGDQA